MSALLIIVCVLAVALVAEDTLVGVRGGDAYSAIIARRVRALRKGR